MVISKAIKKYGVENFKFYLLEEVEEKLLLRVVNHILDIEFHMKWKK